MKFEKLEDGAQSVADWDRFVSDSNDGTVFHTLRFLGYHPGDRFESHHLCIYKRNRLFAVLPGTLCKEQSGPALVSHPGASYGGLVFSDHFSFSDASDLIQGLVDYSTSAGFRRIEMTLPPTAYMATPHQIFEYALISAGFSYRKRELTSIVSLDTPVENVLAGLPQKTRADVRQAQKLGLCVTWRDDPSDEDLGVLYRMLLDNRQDLELKTPPAHSLEELGRIREKLPGMLLLGLTHSGDTSVAGTLVFRCNPQVLLTFYICHDRSARDLHPVHLMLCDLLSEGTRQRYRYVDFGISTVNMKPLHSLIKFKESFNAQGFFRDTFEKVI